MNARVGSLPEAGTASRRGPRGASPPTTRRSPPAPAVVAVDSRVASSHTGAGRLFDGDCRLPGRRPVVAGPAPSAGRRHARWRDRPQRQLPCRAGAPCAPGHGGRTDKSVDPSAGPCGGWAGWCGCLPRRRAARLRGRCWRTSRGLGAGSSASA